MRTITEQNYDMITKALLEEDKKQVEYQEIKLDTVRSMAKEVQGEIEELELAIKEAREKELAKEDEEVEEEIEAKKASSEYTVKYMINHTEYTSKPDANAVVKDKLHYQTITKSTLKELAKYLAKGKTVKPGILIGGTKETFWKEQQLFFVDIDNETATIDSSLLIAEVSGLKPAIVYKSFNYKDSHQKHRLVFVSSRPIRDYATAKAITFRLMNLFGGDEKCKDLGRLYYGTNKSDYILDEKAILSSFKLEALATESIEVVEDKIKVTKDILSTKEIAVGESISYDEVLENISKKPLNKTVSIGKDAWQCISTEIKLTDALNKPLDTLFRCLMPNHEDKNPSASIYEHKGKQYYRCASNCNCETKDIIDTLCAMFNLSRYTVLLDVAKAANVRVGSEYQQQCRNILASMLFDIDYIMPKDTPIRKYLERYNYFGAYTSILQIAGTQMPMFSYTSNDEDICLYLSVERLKQHMFERDMRGATQAHKKLSFFCKIGLLTKLRDEDISLNVLNKLNEIKKQNGYDKRTDLYVINQITPKLLDDSMGIVNKRKELKISNKDDNAKRTLVGFGKEYVESVYVQSETNLSERDIKFIKLMKKAAVKLIAKNSYVTEKQLIRDMDKSNRHFSTAERRKKLKDFRTLLLQDMSIKCVRVNKKNRALYNIDSKVTSNSEVYVAC